jgi:hypothetical protein
MLFLDYRIVEKLAVTCVFLSGGVKKSEEYWQATEQTARLPAPPPLTHTHVCACTHTHARTHTHTEEGVPMGR